MTNARILLISPTSPFQPEFGGQQRVLHTAAALKSIGPVDVLVVASDEENAGPDVLSTSGLSVLSTIKCVNQQKTRLYDHFRRALDPRYLNIHGVAAVAEDRRHVSVLRAGYELIWILNARIPNLLQIWSWPRTHLDIDDLPSRCGPDERTLKGRLITAILRKREHSYRLRFTTLSVCSAEDQRYLRIPQAHVIPNGFRIPTVVPSRRPSATAPRLGFIGLYSHGPNRDGVQWFLGEVWPRICAAVPGVRFRLVGRDSDGALGPQQPDVDSLGWVADPSDEISTWSAMVVPIRYGGGTRIKIADGFSRKCPIVSTRHGAYGYEVEDRRQLRLVDDPAGFADACIELIRHPEIGAAMAERAWTDFLAKWTWDAITPKIHAAAEDCLRRSAAAKA